MPRSQQPRDVGRAAPDRCGGSELSTDGLAWQQQTTKVHDHGGSSPFWNALFTFIVDEYSTSVEIQIMTTAMCTLAPLGVVSIPIDVKSWRDRELHDVWLPVTLGKGTSTTTDSSTLRYGELRVKIEFKLASTLFKHPSVIILTVRRNDLAATAYAAANVTLATKAPPPSPARASQSTTAGHLPPSLLLSPKSAPATKPPPAPQAITCPTVGGLPTIPTLLQPWSQHFIDLSEIQLMAARAGPSTVQLATYKNELVYVQHDMEA
ncbi:hypothetical protein H310_13375 [Aphanomyces invadans]|uniref:C2 domain-containing protein n=1 Tax=Aphanomyces invadans TaxID=157072 RepID=A0A024TFF8_9STRA|nr:hypothetical protein H310_13375 [Aphanomyces invadans]ETV92321.1 hypothetical protein H310_13375 [Aphanomyces invadans]|eukprot:XP_008879072.1 hypothetical protein H310_13375 [Aphanomyces invadans]